MVNKKFVTLVDGSFFTYFSFSKIKVGDAFFDRDFLIYFLDRGDTF